MLFHNVFKQQGRLVKKDRVTTFLTGAIYIYNMWWRADKNQKSLD